MAAAVESNEFQGNSSSNDLLPPESGKFESELESDEDIAEENHKIINRKMIKMQTLMNAAGIGYKTDINIQFLRGIEELPKQFYSCFFCPHFLLVTEEKADEHMKLEHNLQEYSNLLCCIPSNSIIENCFEKEGCNFFLIGCPCQYSVFDKEVLSVTSIKHLVNSNLDDNESNNLEAEICSRYQRLFKAHFKHRLVVKVDDAEENISADLNEIDEDFTQYGNTTDKGSNVVIKDLLKQVGIFYGDGKKFPVKTLPIKQVYEEMFVCCLCPHYVMFRTSEVKIHMNTIHLLKTNYSKLVCRIPTTTIIKDAKPSKVRNYAKLRCLCQHISFPRDILVEPVIDMTYENLKFHFSDVDSDTGKGIDAETKLARIYKYQFQRHHEYKLKVKGLLKDQDIEKKDNVLKNKDKKIENKNQPIDVNADVLKEVINNSGFIKPKDLFALANITESSNTSGRQKKMLVQLPEVVYSCALCPCETIFSEDHLHRHMKVRHDLSGNYSPLYTTVALKDLYQGNHHRRSTRIGLNCICQYTQFGKEMLTMAVINNTYEKLGKELQVHNYDMSLSVEMKLFNIYTAQFKCHNRHKLIMSPWSFINRKEPNENMAVERNISKQANENEKTFQYNKLSVPTNILTERTSDNGNPTDVTKKSIHTDVDETNGITKQVDGHEKKLKDIKLSEPANVITKTTRENINFPEATTKLPDTEVDDVKSENTSRTYYKDKDVKPLAAQGTVKRVTFSKENEKLAADSKEVFRVKDLLRDIGIDEYCRTYTIRKTITECPENLYVCCLCPHTALLSLDEATYHMKRRHNIIRDYSVFITMIKPELVIKASFPHHDGKGIMFDCLCKYATFSSNILLSPEIDRAYEQVCYRQRYNHRQSKMNVSPREKLLKIYDYYFTSHNRYCLSLSKADERDFN